MAESGRAEWGIKDTVALVSGVILLGSIALNLGVNLNTIGTLSERVVEQAEQIKQQRDLIHQLQLEARTSQVEARQMADLAGALKEAIAAQNSHLATFGDRFQGMNSRLRALEAK